MKTIASIAYDKENDDDPTTEQLALRIIKENALFHFDPSSGSDYVTIDNGKVAGDKNHFQQNQEINLNLVPNSTDAPVIETHNGVEMLSFTADDYTQVLKTVGVKIKSGTRKFSTLSVFDLVDDYTMMQEFIALEIQGIFITIKKSVLQDV